MRIFYIGGFVAAIVLALAASARPSAAMVIYPWCADYGGRMGGENCGFTSFAQCQATSAGNGGFCLRNPSLSALPTANGWLPLPCGDDDFSWSRLGDLQWLAPAHVPAPPAATRFARLGRSIGTPVSISSLIPSVSCCMWTR